MNCQQAQEKRPQTSRQGWAITKMQGIVRWFNMSLRGAGIKVLAASSIVLGVVATSHPLPTYAQSTPTTTPQPSPSAVSAVQTATPGEDGAIIHVVQPGETLIAIANAYSIPLTDLMELNGLQGTDIFPEDELIIRLAYTPTPTDLPTATPTPTRQPTATRRPTRTPTVTTLAQETEDGSSSANDEQGGAGDEQNDSDVLGTILLISIGVLGISGIALMGAGSLLKRRKTS